MPVVTLPNGMEVEAPSDREAAFLYHEIFEDGAYVRHGIAVEDGDCVVDVGANIGLFSAALAQRHRDLRIVLFEPVPEVFAMLERNAARLLGSARATVVQAGVSSAPGSVTFEYDPVMSLGAGALPFLRDVEASSRAARREVGLLAWNRAAVEDARRAGLLSDRAAGRLDGALRNRLLRPLAFAGIWALYGLVRLKSRRSRRRFECELTTVSAAIRDHGLERIDLLKIDAEGAEWEILAGIDESDWPRIRQLTMEVHVSALVDRIRASLEARGFTVTVDQDGSPLIELMGFRNLYAHR
jgi:hypothetical protein